MKKRLLVFSALLVGMFVGFTPNAHAVTGQWSETFINYAPSGLKVRYCSDSTSKILYTGDFREKNVCAFYHLDGTRVHVYVAETGTVLFDNVANCDGSRWQYFNTLQDTSNQARVVVNRANC